MKVETFSIEGLVLITPAVYEDERGYFFESYQERIFMEAGIPGGFVQDNESCSRKGVLRGLHFQLPPYAQGKLVRVIQGSVKDVAVDIRKNSPTFGQYIAVTLSAENKKIFWIPPGFAHGFLALEDQTIFSYKCTHFYHKASEGCILWNDPEVAIDWGIDKPLVSSKDLEGNPLTFYRDLFPV